MSRSVKWDYQADLGSQYFFLLCVGGKGSSGVEGTQEMSWIRRPQRGAHWLLFLQSIQQTRD